MATLVLTALGAVVGGPIGAAVGSGIGQAIDRATLFRPAARAGPRLTELGVQTSSYGSAIPKLFGTIRVAGTVIWSTDLIESRTHSGGGKGRPATDTYSYAASFAVLLSARPIVAVRRIWAEGQLLRGAAGDWKTPIGTGTGFRLHPGGDDQPVDPLIASAEGEFAPAHRGCAYAVFEGLPLADYGNRLPSLTFEIVADPGPVTAGGIAAALAGEVDGEADLPIDGFAAAGSDVAGVLEALETMTGAWWRPTGARLAMRTGGAARVLDDAGVTAGRGARRERSVAAAESVARIVSVAHYDPARDYQIGVQQARRPGPGASADRIELPAAMAAASAKAIAAAFLARSAAARTRRTVRAGLEAIDVLPGDVVALTGEDGQWRVTEAALEAMAVTLTLVPLTRPALEAAAMGAGVPAATSGRVLGARDAPIGATLLAAFEIPSLADAPLAAPQLLVAATGAEPGWRRASLLYSLDTGASWIEAGTTAAPAILGTVETVPLATGAAVVDARSALVVELARDDMVLGDADPARIDAGANLALVGDELVQFAQAQPLGAGRWRLTGLARGRRGTEAAIGGQVAGDRFVLLEPDTVRAITLPIVAIGQRIDVMASGAGELDAPVTTSVAVTGASVAPPSPVALAARTTDDGGLAISWIRRSRAGWRWIDAVDAPLGEEAETYEVSVAGGDATTMRTTGAPQLTLAATDLPPRPRRISVRQRGTLGLSPPATIGE